MTKDKTIDVRLIGEAFMRTMRGIIESGEEAIPVVFQILTDGVAIPIGIAGMMSDSEKDKVAEMLQKVQSMPQTACIMLLSDAYYKGIEKGKEVHARLANVPGRKEAISLSVTGEGIKPAQALWIYDRDAAGKPVFNREIEWTTGAQMEGRFVPPQRDSHPRG